MVWFGLACHDGPVQNIMLQREEKKKCEESGQEVEVEFAQGRC